MQTRIGAPHTNNAYHKTDAQNREQRRARHKNDVLQHGKRQDAEEPHLTLTLPLRSSQAYRAKNIDKLLERAVKLAARNRYVLYFASRVPVKSVHIQAVSGSPQLEHDCASVGRGMVLECAERHEDVGDRGVVTGIHPHLPYFRLAG